MTEKKVLGVIEEAGRDGRKELNLWNKRIELLVAKIQDLGLGCVG